jgi:hypothetical protein
MLSWGGNIEYFKEVVMMENEVKEVVIPAPNFETVNVKIIGETKLVIHKFSAKAREQMRQKQTLGSVAKKGQKRDPKNFDELYKGALYQAKEKGSKFKLWYGFNASAIRNAMISACKVVGFHMTKGKLGIFIEPDGFDEESGTPLVRITKGKPHKHESIVRLQTGVCDICVRPMWDEGWEADLRIRYDADMFSREDVMNLLMRAGLQVGICEGRPDSKASCGCGWGTFRVQGMPGAR